jgi:hypothetical protein
LFSSAEELPGDRRAQREQDETSHPVAVAPLKTVFLIFVEHWKAYWLARTETLSSEPDTYDEASQERKK